MEYMFHEGAAFAVKTAYQDLLDLLDLTTPHVTTAEDESVTAELDTVLRSLIGAVLLREDGIREEESAFVASLFTWEKETCHRLLVDHAESWKTLSRQIPGFFQRAVDFDRSQGTNHSFGMRCHIQTIGNNAAVSDQGFGLAERHLVRDYIAHLERHERAAISAAS